MASDVTNELLLETLKQMQATLARHTDELHDIKERLGHVETNVGGLTSAYASLQNRMDRMDLRLERIEKRLDLVDV